MATKKTTVDKTPIEMAMEADVAPVEEKKAPAEEKKAAPKKATKAAEKEVKAEAAAPAEEKKAAKKAPAKKASAAKKEMKSEITVQFAGKSYTQDDLMKIAKDVRDLTLIKQLGSQRSLLCY